MTRRPCTFKQTDLERVLKAAAAVGVRVKIEIEKDKMTVVTIGKMTTMDKDAATGSERNEWDEEYGADQTEISKRIRESET
jgi:hypothetical protein